MAGDLVLITGATGHVGFRTLRSLLESGYIVRAAVRSDAKADFIRSNPVLKDVPTSQLSFVKVTDFTPGGAFDAAVDGVKYVVHLASPIPDADAAKAEDQASHFITPAVRGTVGMLESAKKAGSVKRVVITSSLVANAPPDVLAGATPSTLIYTGDSRYPRVEPPFANPFHAYIASKVAALAEGEAWIKANPDAGFDVIHIHPGYVIGRDDTVRSADQITEGTNGYALSIVLGVRTDQPKAGSLVHVDDVARTHVLALKPDIPGNESYVSVSGGVEGDVWENALNTVHKHFPKAVADGTLLNNGTAPTLRLLVDNSKTERIFGFVHKSYEEQVKSVVGHYLELLGKSD